MKISIWMIGLGLFINAQANPSFEFKPVKCIQLASKAHTSDFLQIHRSGYQGCCSHHSGVCGCDGDTGHLKCCDGTISPSCGC